MTDETRTIRKHPVLGTTEIRTFILNFKRFAAELGVISSVVSCTLYDETEGEDVSTLLTGSTALSDPLVTCKTVDGSTLTAAHEYSLTVTVAYADAQQRSAVLKFDVER